VTSAEVCLSLVPLPKQVAANRRTVILGERRGAGQPLLWHATDTGTPRARERGTEHRGPHVDHPLAILRSHVSTCLGPVTLGANFPCFFSRNDAPFDGSNSCVTERQQSPSVRHARHRDNRDRCARKLFPSQSPNAKGNQVGKSKPPPLQPTNRTRGQSPRRRNIQIASDPRETSPLLSTDLLPVTKTGMSWPDLDKTKSKKTVSLHESRMQTHFATARLAASVHSKTCRLR